MPKKVGWKALSVVWGVLGLATILPAFAINKWAFSSINFLSALIDLVQMAFPLTCLYCAWLPWRRKKIPRLGAYMSLPIFVAVLLGMLMWLDQWLCHESFACYPKHHF